MTHRIVRLALAGAAAAAAFAFTATPADAAPCIRLTTFHNVCLIAD